MLEGVEEEEEEKFVPEGEEVKIDKEDNGYNKRGYGSKRT